MKIPTEDGDGYGDGVRNDDGGDRRGCRQGGRNSYFDKDCLI